MELKFGIIIVIIFIVSFALRSYYKNVVMKHVAFSLSPLNGNNYYKFAGAIIGEHRDDEYVDVIYKMYTSPSNDFTGYVLSEFHNYISNVYEYGSKAENLELTRLAKLSDEEFYILSLYSFIMSIACQRSIGPFEIYTTDSMVRYGAISYDSVNSLTEYGKQLYVPQYFLELQLTENRKLKKLVHNIHPENTLSIIKSNTLNVSCF